MTLSQARAIYKQALVLASPSNTGLTISQAAEAKKLAKLLAKIGGFEQWEIEE
jgi:hypothetical protein